MKKYVSAKRAHTLINELIGYLSELKKTPELIQTLINCGFTYEELVTFYSFDPDEIAGSFEGTKAYESSPLRTYLYSSSSPLLPIYE